MIIPAVSVLIPYFKAAAKRWEGHEKQSEEERKAKRAAYQRKWRADQKKKEKE